MGLFNSSCPDERMAKGYRLDRGVFIDENRRYGLHDNDNTIEIWQDINSRLSIPYLLQLALLKSNRSFIHSAAVAFESKSFVFPAFGGIGKTLLVSQLLTHKEVRLLGDDLCIVNAGGSAAAYPRPLCLYEHHRDMLKPVFDRFGIEHTWPNFLGRAARRMRDISYTYTGLSFPYNRYHGIKGDYILISPITIYGWEKICVEELPIGAVIILRRRPNLKKIEISEYSRENAIRFSTNVTLHEWKSEAASMLVHSAVGSNLYSQESMEMIIRSAFELVPKILVMHLPEDIDVSEYIDLVIDIMKNT